MPDILTLDQAAEKIGGKNPPPDIIDALVRHQSAGKGIAVYENNDLGHSALGHCVAFTYGTPEAQFEPEQFPDGPPSRCPDGLMRDITGGINWRYGLIGIIPPPEVSRATA